MIGMNTNDMAHRRVRESRAAGLTVRTRSRRYSGRDHRPLCVVWCEEHEHVLFQRYPGEGAVNDEEVVVETTWDQDKSFKFILIDSIFLYSLFIMKR